MLHILRHFVFWLIVVGIIKMDFTVWVWTLEERLVLIGSCACAALFTALITDI